MYGKDIMIGFFCNICMLALVLLLYANIYPKIIKYRESVIISIVIIYSVVIAIGPNTVPDKSGYEFIFSLISITHDYGFDLFDEVYTVEYGFLYWIIIIKTIINDSGFFYFCNTLCTVGVFMCAIKRIDMMLNLRINRALLLAMYVSYYGVYYNSIAIRQGLAMSMCVLALSYFLEKKYIIAVILLFIGFLFHRLAILGIFTIFCYYFAKKRIISEKVYFGVLVLLLAKYLFDTSTGINPLIYDLLLMVLSILNLDTVYGAWLEDMSGLMSAMSVTNLYVFFLVGCVCWVSRKNENMRPFVFICYTGLLISVLLANMKASCRIYDFFLFYYLIILTSAQIKKRERQIIPIAIIIANLVLISATLFS